MQRYGDLCIHAIPIYMDLQFKMTFTVLLGRHTRVFLENAVKVRVIVVA